MADAQEWSGGRLKPRLGFLRGREARLRRLEMGRESCRGAWLAPACRLGCDELIEDGGDMIEAVGVAGGTFLETDNTIAPAPFISLKAPEVSRAVARDFVALVTGARLDVAQALAAPASEYVAEPSVFVELLLHDLDRLLRDGLILGVHLLLADPLADPSGQSEPLLYHARYLIAPPSVAPGPAHNAPDDDDQEQPEQPRQLTPADAVALAIRAARGARFALLIDWNARIEPAQASQAQRPTYLFDWSPLDRFGPHSLVRYYAGGLRTELVNVASAATVGVY